MVKSSASALALALSLSPAAFAETTDTHTDIILVTATRSPADAESLPASVTILDREQIDIEAQVTLSDLLTTVPGLQAVQSGPAGSLTSVFIRGANAKHTLALYDGIRINDASSATGVFNFGSETLGDTGRVEVIRGPLSSVHGSDAVGGVINILPRALSTEGVAPRAALELGELGTLRASAGVDLARDSWRLGVSVEQLTTEGYDVTPARLSTANGDPDGAEFRTLTARGEVDLTAGVTLDGLYRWRDSRADFDGFSGGPSGFQRADDPDLESEDRLQVWALGLVHEGPALSTAPARRSGLYRTRQL
jgi:vitamin B12 transporter